MHFFWFFIPTGIYLPRTKYMNISPYPHNITVFYNDIQISNVGIKIHFEFSLICFVVAAFILQNVC